MINRFAYKARAPTKECLMRFKNKKLFIKYFIL